MKLLITGICGFVGSSLAHYLVSSRAGLSVFGIDNLMRPGSEINRARLRKIGVTFLHGDARLASDLASLPAADWVIDAAADPTVLAGVNGSSTTRQLLEHNLVAFMNTLEYCKEHRAGLILLSSSRVYSIAALSALPLKVCGNTFRLDRAASLPVGVSETGIGTDFSTKPPVSLYGSTKLAAEIIALEYAQAFQFPVWIDRCGVLAGPGQFGTADQGIFSFWINAHLRHKPLKFIGFGGTGKQVRDALHPHDLGDLVNRQMATPRIAGQRVYTAGGGPQNAMSLAELTAWCDTHFGVHVPEPDAQPRVYDVPWLIMDNQDAERDFHWHVNVSLEELLSQIACHAQQNPEWLERSGA